jgi:Reverse transcriptase (RNA-dependent DNA polymerase)
MISLRLGLPEAPPLRCRICFMRQLMLLNTAIILDFFIDFSKAFDTVPHHQLLGKLLSYNCPQILINWIANYWTDRA